MKQKQNRPKLGQRIKARDRLIREHKRMPDGVVIQTWVCCGDRISPYYKPRPVDGVFMGFRAKSNGSPAEYFEVWLIVENSRSNPVFVLPESIILEGSP